MKKYKTWVFDCDGVLLDSNRLKTDAFYKVALPYGESIAQQFLDYHGRNAGVSRYIKIEFLWTDILGNPKDDEEINRLLEEFATLCRKGLESCDETPKVREVLSLISDKKRYVVSGGKESELKEAFSNRGLDRYFDEIYGSPRTKIDIISDIDLEMPGVLIGDSKGDYIAANHYGLDFVFMTQYTEFVGWEDFFDGKSVLVIRNMENVYDSLS